MSYTVTLEQYTTAKDIVLDLLGWGVAPEYLVDCGFSREIVYYVFSELNLRLPSNFDATGILPYPPTPEMVASWLGVSYDSSEQSSGKPASLRSRGSVSHPLPQKPPLVSPQGLFVLLFLRSRFLNIVCRECGDADIQASVNSHNVIGIGF